MSRSVSQRRLQSAAAASELRALLGQVELSPLKRRRLARPPDPSDKENVDANVRSPQRGPEDAEDSDDSDSANAGVEREYDDDVSDNGATDAAEGERDGDRNGEGSAAANGRRLRRSARHSSVLSAAPARPPVRSLSPRSHLLSSPSANRTCLPLSSAADCSPPLLCRALCTVRWCISRASRSAHQHRRRHRPLLLPRLLLCGHPRGCRPLALRPRKPPTPPREHRLPRGTSQSSTAHRSAHSWRSSPWTKSTNARAARRAELSGAEMSRGTTRRRRS